MASHQLAIAKASFSAGLLRPDPTSVPRDEITAFHTSLDRALSHCTPTNIQNCKTWLIHHVVSSSNRVGVWAKYLVALSGSLEDDAKAADPRRISGKRRRLHMLYLLNDLFHHTKYHSHTSAAFSTLSGSIQPYIVELLGLAAAFDREKHPKHHRRLDDVLNIWDESGYYSSDYVNKLREVVKNSALTGPVKASIGVEENNTEPASNTPKRDAPFVMPPTHGDASTPYYDLPAGNLVPHIIPNSTISLRPDSIKPLQFLAGPADEKLVDAVKVFLGDVDRIYGTDNPEPKEDETMDIDELGQTVIRDGMTGDIIDGETYYGWSRAFCQQMKKGTGAPESRSRSRSRTQSPSQGYRRSRYSSPASDDSRRSYSRSRSPRRGHGRRYRSYSRSRSRSRRRSPSHDQSYSPPPPASTPAYPPQQYAHTVPPMPYPPPTMGPGMVPPPPNYQGPWPPLPPFPMGVTPGAPSFPPGGYFPPPHMGQHMPPGPQNFPTSHPGPAGGPWQSAYPPRRR